MFLGHVRFMRHVINLARYCTKHYVQGPLVVAGCVETWCAGDVTHSVWCLFWVLGLKSMLPLQHIHIVMLIQVCTPVPTWQMYGKGVRPAWCRYELSSMLGVVKMYWSPVTLIAAQRQHKLGAPEERQPQQNITNTPAAAAHA